MIGIAPGGSRAMMRRIKASLAWGAMTVGVGTLARARQRDTLRVLMYHGVLARVNGPASYDNLFMTREAFVRQMRYLSRTCTVVSLEDAVERFTTGQGFPVRAAAITIDDGYRNTVTTALPILRELGLPATVFVTGDLTDAQELLWFDALRVLVAECVDRRTTADLGSEVVVAGRGVTNVETAYWTLNRRIHRLGREGIECVTKRLSALSRDGGWAARYPDFALAGWAEWREAVADGTISVGAHGLAHGKLLQMSREERLHDLRETKQRIEAQLARPCRAVAYPYNEWNQDVAAAARQAGYLCGVTADDGLNRAADDPFTLRRTMIGDKGSFPLFCARVSGAWDELRVAAGRGLRV